MLTLTDLAESRLPGWRKLVARHEARFFGAPTAGECEIMTRLLHKLWTTAEGIDVGPDQGT